MKTRLLLTLAVLMLASCATYKPLKPKPLPVNQEQGYVELKKGEKNFPLKKNKKYCIAFPAPTDDHFCLVITSPFLRKLDRSCTADLDKKKTPEPRIADQTFAPDTMSVYAVDKSATRYFWLVDRVPEDMELSLHYRYIPQWRFTFEHKYVSYCDTLARNLVDRSAYNTIGVNLHPDGVSFNYSLAIDSVSRHTAALQVLHKELLGLERLFPSAVLTSNDVAYQRYKKLKQDLEEEIAFQSSYANVLRFFFKEYQTRGNTFAFLGDIEDFIFYFSLRNSLPGPVVAESRSYLNQRVGEALRFFEARLAEKDDLVPFDTAYFRAGALRRIRPLCEVSGIDFNADFDNLIKFMNDFDAKGPLLAPLGDSLAAVRRQVLAAPPMPSDEFFTNVNARMAELQAAVPAPLGQSYGKYSDAVCGQKINQEIAKLNTGLLAAAAQYRDAGALVARLNVLLQAADFGGMIRLVRQNLHIGFLADKYRDLDKMSLDQQTRNISSSFASNNWPQAEDGLRTLLADANYLDPAMIPRKQAVVLAFEDSLYAGVERVTRARVDKFLTDNIGAFDRIDSLYADSVFLPVYSIRFSSGSRSDLAARKTALVADLDRMKQFEFPAKAIRLLYEQFVRTPDDNGVLKARAIIAHSRHYAGDDKEIKMRVSEVDPLLAKWITKPTEYRRVFVIPVTDNQKGKNKYVVRFNIKIPTEAMFPVYDVNIKLPKEVAQDAAAAQWYDEISLNGKQLKNEGRFTITAPMASNNYECQITPVQMNKDTKNFLELVFHSAGFKVLQVSVMVQKPIIKKN